MQLRFAVPDELDRVVQFYGETDYHGGVVSSDRVVLLQRGSEIAGAYRLAREQGTLILRGMRVRPELRGRGFGRLLLTVLSGVREPCYCVPHAHLRPFYGQVKFSVVPQGEGPVFLQDRVASYNSQGLRVVLMLRASS